MTGPSTLSRRSLLSIGAGCFAGSLLVDSWLFGSAAADASGSVWQQRWGDATQRRFAPADPDPESLVESWSITIEPRESLDVECIDADRVYVRDYNRILAYDRDGSRAWVYTADEGSFAPPTLIDNSLIVHENSTVHSIAAGDGTTRWTGGFRAPHLPSGTVLDGDGGVYLAEGDRVVVVQPETGFRRRAIDAELLGRLVAATDTQLFWWTEGTLYATGTDGAIDWRTTFDQSYAASGRTVAITDQQVILRHFTATDVPTVTALDRETGDRVWETDFGLGETVSVTAGPDTAYVGSNHRLQAFALDSGEKHWERMTDRATPTPVVTPQTVYLPTDDGILPADPADGEPRTERLLGDRPITSLGAVEGGLYATTNTELLALEGAT